MPDETMSKQIESEIERVKRALFDLWQAPFYLDDFKDLVIEALERMDEEHGRQGRMEGLEDEINRRHQDDEAEKIEAERSAGTNLQ
jgi:hypothetical protein